MNNETTKKKLILKLYGIHKALKIFKSVKTNVQVH